MTTDNSTPNYGFDDPADNAIANEIASMDPIRDLRGANYLANEADTNIQFPVNIPLSTFSPEVQATIRAKAQGNAAEEQRLANEEARAKSLGARTKGWQDVTDPYWRESLRQENEEKELNAELIRLEFELTAVERFDAVEDPITGAQSPKAVEKLQGYQRKQVEAERDRIIGQLQDLNGRGGKLKLEKAMREAVEARKDTARKLEERAEVKRRGEELIREQRIEAAAQSYARLRQHSV